MNRIAANPLMIITGKYWLTESSTASDCLATTGRNRDGDITRGWATSAEVEESEADLERADKWLTTFGRDYFRPPAVRARVAVLCCRYRWQR
jgi:hypothetical protein